jgi:hypothetical protein
MLRPPPVKFQPRRLAGGLTVVVAVLGMCAPAQASRADIRIIPAIYPKLPPAGPAPASFVPKGWAVEKKIEGDLNGDGLADLVLLLHERDPKKLVRDRFGDPLDTNPRILAVALRHRQGGYRLVLQNHTLISRLVDHEVMDVMDNGMVEIRRGVLRIRVSFFAAVGTWTMSNSTFSFAWRDGRLALIGWDEFSISRNSGESSEASANFVTRRAKLTTQEDEDSPERTRWIRLPHRPLLTMDQIGDGLEFKAAGLPGL